MQMVAFSQDTQVVLMVKSPLANAGDASPGEGNSNLLQCSYLENVMDRGA